MTPATLTVEFGCDRFCQVEIDLEDVDSRTTLARLRDRANTAHKAAHAADAFQRVFKFGPEILVRAGAPIGAVR